MEQQERDKVLSEIREYFPVWRVEEWLNEEMARKETIYGFFGTNAKVELNKKKRLKVEKKLNKFRIYQKDSIWEWQTNAAAQGYELIGDMCADLELYELCVPLYYAGMISDGNKDSSRNCAVKYNKMVELLGFNSRFRSSKLNKKLEV